MSSSAVMVIFGMKGELVRRCGSFGCGGGGSMVDTTLSILCKSSNGHCTKHIQMHSHLILWSSAMFYQYVLQSYTGSDKKSMMWICICICVCICILRKMGLNNATGLKLLLSGLGKVPLSAAAWLQTFKWVHPLHISLPMNTLPKEPLDQAKG